MRFKSLGKLACLSLLVIAMTGCCCLSPCRGDPGPGGPGSPEPIVHPDDPWLPRGLVRIMKNGQPAPVGFVMTVDNGSGGDTQYWLMRDFESPPVNASLGDSYEFFYENAMEKSLEDFYNEYMPQLPAPNPTFGEGPAQLFSVETTITPVSFP